MTYPYTHRNHRARCIPAARPRRLCEAAAEGDAGKGMFTTGLSPDGTEPASHYISSGPIANEFGTCCRSHRLTRRCAHNPPRRCGNGGAIADAGITLPWDGRRTVRRD